MRIFGILYQYVDVPLVASTCPAVPVALVESRSSPVSCNLAIVEEARKESPEDVNDPDVIRFVVVAFVIVAFVVVELPTMRSVMFASDEKKVEMTPLVEKKLVEVALVRVALVAVRLVKIPVIAVRRLVKNVEEVALTVTSSLIVPLVALILVVVALTAVRLVVEAVARYATFALIPVVEAFPSTV